MFNDSMNTSSNAVAAMISGQMKEIENGCKTVVDVRDVAAAHIAAWEGYPEVVLKPELHID